MIVYASDKSIAAFDAVNKSFLAKKFKRAVNRDRRRPGLMLEAVDDFVGAEGAMAAKQDLQHLAPHRSEPLVPCGALRFGMGDGGAGAALVIVIGSREDCGHECLEESLA